VHIGYLIPRSREDLIRRREGLRRWADGTFGLIGRGPEHVASFLAGFSGNSEVFGRGGERYAENVRNFHAYARDNDQYVTYAIAQPQIDRSKPAHQQEDPFLYAGVKEERDDGIVIKGAQMMATGSAIADWVLLSNIMPLGEGDEAYAFSVVIPMGAPGVKILTRRSYGQAAPSTFDNPLSSRFDESDSLLIFEDVFVPWEHVFVYRDLKLVSAQWWEVPSHALGNNQAQIRLSSKLDFLVGLAHRIADMNGLGKVPPVQAIISEMASYASAVSGLVYGSEENCTIDEYGVAHPGAEEVHSAMSIQLTMFPRVMQLFRELVGGGVIQLPSSYKDYLNPDTAEMLERYVQSPGWPSAERVKLLKMAWDFLGSEFGARHQQYEIFYGGSPHLVRMRMYRSYDFSRATALVDSALSGYGLPDADGEVAPPAAAADGAVR
jgi:4-hydroxyphenylacetate 3-monooxygenase